MGTTADKLNKILQTKEAIRQSIIGKGVDVTSSDTFASYSAKIDSIKASGGSAEYQYVNDISEVTYPRQVMSSAEWQSSGKFFLNDFDGFKKTSEEFAFYSTSANSGLLFDGNLGNNADYKCSLKFGESAKIMSIEIAGSVTIGLSPEIEIYGTDNPDLLLANDTSKMTLIAKLLNGKWNMTTLTTEVINSDKSFKYYYITGYPDRTVITEMKLNVISGSTTLTLKSANMTPAINYNKVPAEITTQPFYDGVKIIDSKKLLFKPYADGGALIDYVDNREPVNLGLYLMHPDGVTEMPGDYDNFEVNGSPNIDSKTGIFSNPVNPGYINLPTFTSNNFEMAVKVMSTNVGGDNRISMDKNYIRDLMYIYNSRFSTYMNQAVINGTTEIQPNTVYWLKVVGTPGNIKGYLSVSDAPECPATEDMNLEFDTVMPDMAGHDFTLGPGYPGQSFSGNIYLEGAYVKVDGVEVWTPRGKKLSTEYIYLLAQNDFVPPAGFDNKTLVSTLVLPDRHTVIELPLPIEPME